MKFILSADGNLAANTDKFDTIEIGYINESYIIYASDENGKKFLLAECSTYNEAKKRMVDLLKVLTEYAANGVLNLKEAASDD